MTSTSDADFPDVAERIRDETRRRVIAVEAIVGLAKHMGAVHVDIAWPEALGLVEHAVRGQRGGIHWRGPDGVTVTTAVEDRICRYCGCTDDSGCVGADRICSWVADDVCSACLEAGKAGREVDASVANAHGMVWSSTYAPGDDLSKPSDRGVWVKAPRYPIDRATAGVRRDAAARHYAGEPVATVRISDGVYTISPQRQFGLEIQSEPWHYRWTGDPKGPHNPRRCALCRLERAAVRLGLAHYAPDMCPCEANHTPEGGCPDQCGHCGWVGDPDEAGMASRATNPLWPTSTPDRWYRSWPMHNGVAHPIGEALHWLARVWGGDDTLGNRLHDATLPTHEEGTGRG